MPAAVLTAPRTIRWEERKAAPLRPGEVRARVLRAGICGTDLAIWNGDYRVPLPLVLGHEWVGEVTETGGVEAGGWLGRRVTAEINQACAARGLTDPCPECRAGSPAHCHRRKVTGIAGADGAFQQEITLPAAVLHALPETWPADWGVFVEPLAAALQTFALSPVVRSEVVVVLGPGRLGILIALAAAELGARTLVAGRSSRRLDLARELGLETQAWDFSLRAEPEDPLSPAPSPLLERVLEMTGGRGAGLVVEATGDPAGLGLALDLARPRGTVALKSTPGRPVPAFNMTRAVVGEIRLQGSRCGDFGEAIRFQERVRLPLDRLIERRFPFKHLAGALEAAGQGGKTVLDFD